MDTKLTILLKRYLAASSSPQASPSSGSIATAIREQLILLGFVVSFVGLVYTDAYYSAFSVKYQLLAFPATHIVYQGLAATITNPWLLVLYLVSAILLQAFDFSHAAKQRSDLARAVMVCCFVPVLLATAYSLANSTGKKRASIDRDIHQCTLPRVVWMTVEKVGNFCGKDQLRLLLIDSTHVVVFVPQLYAASVPNVKRYLKGDVHELETSP